MLSSQQRATYSAGKQSGSKSASANAASTSTPTSIRLPPALTENALSTLCRLPIRCDSTINWQRYDCGSNGDNNEKARIAHEALLQLSLAESKAFGFGSSACGLSASNQSSLPLLQSTLWTIERAPSHIAKQVAHITSIWLFQIQRSDRIAESSGAATSEERRQATKSKDEVEKKLAQFKARREQGCCRLQDLYNSLTPATCDDPLLLTPAASHARLLPRFLEALEEHFLASWVWSGSNLTQREQSIEKRASTSGETKGELKPTQAKMVDESEKDEEEEGAIRDNMTGSSRPNALIDYWPSSQRRSRRKAIRFGSGIVLQQSKISDSLFDKSHLRDRQAICLTLRCFVDEQGRIYLETRPTKGNGMHHIEDINVSNRRALLAPGGNQALLIERIKDSGWSGQGGRHGDREGEKQAYDCKEGLLALLQVRGVDIDDLDDDWMLCETEHKRRFLWPTKLCFALPLEPDKDINKLDHPSLPIFLKPLLDVAERAKGLVRESVGMRNIAGNSDAMMLDADLEQDEDDNDDIDADAEGEEHEEDEDGDSDERKGRSIQQSNNLNDAAAASSTTKEERKESGIALGKVSHEAVEENKALSKDEEETDLWGTFGFGLQDDGNKDLSRRQSAAGLDEGGFGLITEDDFDFFDEAAKGVGAFDDMDVDISQREISDSRGDATFRSLDTDNGSDLAMTNSTFLDPPSLPGFTPGSLSNTSENDAKAHGGLNAKTPRTPFSPSQDLVDAQVSIEGEGDSIFNDSRRYHGHHDDMSFASMSSHLLEPRNGSKTDMINEESHTWNPQNREHLMSKYEEGKFALPRVPTSRKRGETEEGSEAYSRSEKDVHPRNRLRHRIQSDRRLSGGKSILSRKVKAGNSLLRNDEETSDQEATIDGSISDRSSIMDEDSDNDMTSASGDTRGEEGLCLGDRVSLLQSAIEAVQGLSQTPMQEQAVEESKELLEVDPVKDARIAKSLKRLAYNPQVRLCVCPVQEDHNDTLVRSLAKELFAPLPLAAEDNKLKVLLSRNDAKYQKASIQLLEAPKIMVGCQGAIASMEPTALSKWDKLGLAAVSGPKNVAAMALHCGCLPASWQKELLDWLSAFNDAFVRNGFGQQTLADDALLALGESHHTSISQILVQTHKNAEQWTDTIDSLLSRMQSYLSQGQFVVIYAIGVQIQPHCIWILSKLEMDLREVAKSRWDTDPDLINIRGIQWKTVATSLRAIDGPSSMFRLGMFLYDSLDVPVQQHYNHKDHLPIIRSEPVGVVYPSFTLSPLNHLARSKAQFQLQWKSEPFNLADAGLLLNVGYHIGKSPGELTFMSIMDEKAQGYFVDGWRRKGDVKSELDYIWERVQTYAAQVRVLWRIVLCKRDQMQMDEVQLWSSLLKQPSDSMRAIDITLTCLDIHTPITLVLPRQNRCEVAEVPTSTLRRPTKESDDKSTHYIDATQVDYAVYPSFRIAMCQENDNQDILLPLQSSATISFSDQYNGSVAASTCDADKAWSRTAPRHFWIHLLQVYQAPYSNFKEPLSLYDRTSIITTSFHQLTFIGRERFLFDDNLPWHISILAIANRARHLF